MSAATPGTVQPLLGILGGTVSVYSNYATPLYADPMVLSLQVKLLHHLLYMLQLCTCLKAFICEVEKRLKLA